MKRSVSFYETPESPRGEKLSAHALFWVLLILLSGAFIYAHSLNNKFIWDDNAYVLNNPAINTWKGITHIWSHPRVPEYYPVTFSVLWLEHKLWGFSAWGYHMVSLTLHILNALLLFGLFREKNERLAGITALLFTIHPIQVETVAWVSEQKNLLCFFFFALAVHAWLDHQKKERRSAYVRMIFFFIAALWSKSIAVCFAFIPLLHEWWQYGSLKKRGLFTALFLLFIGGLNAAFHLHLIHLYDIPEQLPDPLPAGLGRAFMVARIFFFYIQQILFPQRFMTFYPKWDFAGTPLTHACYLAALIGLYVLLFRKRHCWGRDLFALLCFYGLSLLPVLGLIDFAWYRFSYVADHFAYLSVPAILLLAYGGVALLFKKIRENGNEKLGNPSAFFKVSLWGIALATCVHLSVISFRLTFHYRDNITLWSYNLLQNPRSPFIYYHLGIVCRQVPDFCTTDQVITAFQKAIQLKPDLLPAYAYLGEAYVKAHRDKEALQAYQKASTLAMPLAKASCYAAIAHIHLSQESPADAVAYLTKATELEAYPEYRKKKKIRSEILLQEAFIRYDLGMAYLKLGDHRKAARSFRDAVSRDPRHADSYLGLGIALMRQKDYKNAGIAFEKAQQIDPKNEIIKRNLGWARAAENMSGSEQPPSQM